MYARVAAFSFTPVPQEQPQRLSCTKYLERRIVCAWKTISRRSRRRHNRASILSEDFVMLTSRRRSIRYAM